MAIAYSLSMITVCSMEGRSSDNQRFIARLSHDIRAPIRHLTEFSKILADTIASPSEEQERYLAFIDASAKRCNAMIEGLGKLSKINSCMLRPACCDLEVLVRELFSRLATVEHTEASLEVHADRETMVDIDPEHAEELAVRLIENAFKFRKPEVPLRLLVTLSRVGEQVEISFVDNGIGINDAYSAQAAQLFSQFNNKAAGEGVGLALVQSIVDRYEGSLRVAAAENCEDCGFSATVVLPAYQLEANGSVTESLQA